MRIPVRIGSFHLSSGSEVSLPRAGVTCVVGGNNVGKSQLLNELATRVAYPHRASSIVVADLCLDRPDINLDDAEAFLCQFGIPRRMGPGQALLYSAEHGPAVRLTPADFKSHFEATDCLQDAHAFFVWHASAGSLLRTASNTIPLGNDEPFTTNPIGRLFRDGSLEAELSNLSNEAFGVALTLDRINGEVLLRVGAPTLAPPPINHPTREYADEVAGLPPLDQQGDGIKSFLGIALSVLAGSCQVLLIDEPEAFLHPAQARTLGRWLAAQARERDLQVVLATHDKDLLLGLLESGDTSTLTVLGLSRSGDTSSIHQVKPDEIAEIWSDQVLRYSNLLQGLFHRRVVICEADADCRFYSAVLDSLASQNGSRYHADETLFVPSGGKQRVASMAKAVKALGVETWAMLDFDVLNKKATVKAIVEAIGHDWDEELERDYIAFAAPINQQHHWDLVKHAGLAGVPAGSPHAAATRLLEALRDRGVLVVPVGEMEDFDKSIGAHGASWVSTMLAAEGHRTCTAASDLVTSLLNGA